MKKNVGILLIILIIASLSACGTQGNNEITENTTPAPQTSPEPTPNENAKPTYKDGSYEASGDKWEHGQEDATVVINDGQIKSIALRRLDTEGNEVNYDKWTGEEIDGKLYPDLKQYRLDLADNMIEKQTWDVDAISGATVSSENWKLAVKRALEKAKQ